MSDPKTPPTVKRLAEKMVEAKKYAVSVMGPTAIPPRGGHIISDGVYIAEAFLKLLAACETERNYSGTLPDDINTAVNEANP